MSLHLEISQGLRVDDLSALQEKVQLRGGRLVAYTEVISAVLISARSYKVKWVGSPEERRRAGVLSTVVTAILGWWAIVGPYRSITAFIWNSRGGFDVTDALLRAHPGNSSLLGYSETVALGAFQESASRPAKRVCLGLLILFLVTFGCLMWTFSRK
jgi:hypothetical protein